jgi:hypothetical protein
MQASRRSSYCIFREKKIMSISEAISIAKAYEKRQVDFQERHELLSRIFHGTRLIKPMAELIEYVAQAAQLNRVAGWLPEDSTFTAREYFITCIKHDQHGDVVRSLADVPEAVQPEYAAWDEQGFQLYIKSLREAYRRAQEEMEEVCSGLERMQLVSGSSLFIRLSALIDEDSVDDEEPSDVVMKHFESFFFNLEAEWLGYTELACSLIQMANEPPESAWRRSQAADFQLYADRVAALKAGSPQC